MTSTIPISNATVAVGVDLGTFHARVATYDTNLENAVVSANHDGHHATRVLVDDNSQEPQEGVPTTLVPADSVELLDAFYREKMLQLASDSAHTKDLAVVSSIPNDISERPEGWLEALQTFGSVVTEAVAIAFAYQVDPQTLRRVLVLDGGANGLKATVLVGCGSGMWAQKYYKRLESVHGSALVEPLAQAVAQQFEQTHRFPRNEVWQSKKAKRKLVQACQQSLSTFQRMNHVSIHVDGLYEGMDCNVRISKPKFEHLCSKLAQQVKTFCAELSNLDSSKNTFDQVLIAGKLHDWITPIVKPIFGADKISSSQMNNNSSIDPAEAVAIGCTLHAYWNLQHQLSQTSPTATSSATMSVQCSPVAIGISASNSSDEESKEDTTTLIAQGSPLPCFVTHTIEEAMESLNLVQLEPSSKALAQLEDLEASTTLQLQLNSEGRLRIWVNGEDIVIG